MQKWTICAEYADLLDGHNPEKRDTNLFMKVEKRIYFLKRWGKYEQHH